MSLYINLSTELTDYQPTTGELEFQPSTVPQVSCAEIPIVNDTTVETQEAFFIMLSSSDPVVHTPSSPITVTILDNDGRLHTLVT